MHYRRRLMSYIRAVETLEPAITQPEFLAQFEEQESEWQGPWGNLVFLKDGRSALGTDRYPDLAGAVEDVRVKEELLRSLPPGTLLVTNNLVYRADEYSHCIQVPVKG